MTSTATATKPTSASLDALYSLIRDDLGNVDALILARVKNEVPLIGEIARHIVASGGKRIRPALTLISAQAAGYSGDKHIALAAAIEFIHTATLLHDDVVDASALRRGMATANELFGNKASVLVGDFLLSQAFQIMVESGSLKALGILADASAVISKGEVMQLMCEGELTTSTEDYLKVIAAKTAALFAAACELGAVVSGKETLAEPLRNFGMHIGTAFQLIDDALDYAAKEAELGKTLGDDFREGKVTLPVIVAYGAASSEEKAFWKRTVADLDQKPEDFDTACRIIARHGAIAKTISTAHGYCQKARVALSAFGPSPAKDAMLDIIDFCAARTY